MENEPNKPPFVVGVGASAGGLEAFNSFFSNVSPDTGAAFVVIQHLDPTHKGMLPEILQRVSTIPVVEIEDGMAVEPNRVHVIPPNREVSILHGTLQLLEPSMPHGQRLPIDAFLNHLAHDQGDSAIAVILSGMGTDGTLGIKAIKEKLGMVMVQDPADAKFDGMPKAAIATGLADYVAPVSELPAKLAHYIEHKSRIPEGAMVPTDRVSSALKKISVLIRARTGHDFSLYKNETIRRRVKRRMDVHIIVSVDDYIRYLQEHPQEVDLLFQEILIGVTSFFRNPETFDVLKEQMMKYLQEEEDRESLRAWVIGCSTGEEAYSIAIILKESIDAVADMDAIDIQVFATDIHRDAIDTARRGFYSASIADDVSAGRLKKFFTKEGDGYKVRKEIRDMIVFAPQNVTMDPPFTKMDLVSCRNLLIYFSPELQNRVVPLLHYSLKTGGILFLGPSETVSGFSGLFSALDVKSKIYSKLRAGDVHPDISEFPTSRIHVRTKAPTPPPAKPEVGVTEIARDLLLEHYTPPAVIINEGGDIMYVSGRTGNYLEPSPGKANMNVYAMAREGLRQELGIVIRKAISQRSEVSQKGINVKTNGSDQAIDLTVKPVARRDLDRLLLIVVFQDVKVPPSRRRSTRKGPPEAEQNAIINQLEDELRQNKEQLQETMEQMQATHEELQSANEELQSSNEEMQSTNEELTTSKEELQSLNEELTTLNTELQTKVEQLSQANDDMNNLLNSTGIASIFLDGKLHIRRFTEAAANFIKMIHSDIGRPLSDLVSKLKDVDLAGAADDVLQNLTPREIQVQKDDGRWYLIRLLPYRTSENLVDGVVITFTEISDFKHVERSLKDERNLADNIVATIRDPMLVLDKDMKVVSASRAFFTKFKVSQEETLGQYLYKLGNMQWDIPELRRLLEEVLPEHREVEDFPVEHDFPGIGLRRMLLNARTLHREEEDEPLILLAIEGCD